MKGRTKSIITISLIATIGVISCKKDGGINFFTLSQDREFGEQMDEQIRSNPTEFPLLDPLQDKETIDYIQGMFDHVLTSSEIKHRNDFDWKVTVIEKDVVNAFATPGGKIYIYTGLISFLKNGAELAGVVAHEVAHSDRRHSTQQMTKVYGFQILLDIILGKDKTMAEQIGKDLGTGLATLAFSREHEYEADEYAVRYLASGNKYSPIAMKGFFEKMMGSKKPNGEMWEFLKTHPSDEKRMEAMQSVYNSLPSKGSSDVDQNNFDKIQALY